MREERICPHQGAVAGREGGGRGGGGGGREGDRRTATAVAEEEEDPVRWRRSHIAGTLRAYRDPEFCLAYARTNPSICASFLPRMATTSFQGRSRRLPLTLLHPYPFVVVPPRLAPLPRIFRARRIPPRAMMREAGARSTGIRDRRSR